MGLLVLSRREGEAIQIGEDVKVVVSRIQGGSVRLALNVAPHLKVLRDDAKRTEPKERAA